MFFRRPKIVAARQPALKPQRPHSTQPVRPIKNKHTPLHRLVRKHPDLQQLQTGIKEMGDNAAKWSRTLNDNGELPIDYLYFKQRTSDERRKLFRELYTLMLAQEVKPLSVLVDSNEIMFAAKNHTPQLLENLQLGCDLINCARKIIHESYTHPQTNHYSKDKQLDLFKRINKNRSLVRAKFIQDTSKLEDTMMYAEMSEQEGLGNCGEFSDLIVALLSKLAGDTPRASLFELANGSHSFVVLGLNENSVDNKPETWGPAAVVVDAWAGLAYPAILDGESALPEYLGDHRFVPISDDYFQQAYLNFILNYNPHYHELHCYLNIEAKQIKKHYMRSGFFNTQNKTSKDELQQAASEPSAFKIKV